MNDIYEAVRMAIKSKIPAEKEVDGHVVKTNREDILQGIPFQVKRAVVKLQESEVIPPRMFNFDPTSEKNSFVDANGETIYSYVQLPDDFISLDSLQVSGRPVDWKYYDNEHMINRMSKLKEEPLYKIMKMNLTDVGGYRDVLIMAPWPENTVFVKYYQSGSKSFIEGIEEKYWGAIITRVEAQLGLGSKKEADDEASEIATQWANSQRRGEVMTTKPRFFGMGLGRTTKRRI